MPSAHGAKRATKPNRNNRPTDAHRACFYPALLIGDVAGALLAIVVSPSGYDSILRCSPRHAAAAGLRVPMRLALLRALRRDVWAAHWQRSSRRGALFHWTDGASSQAIERGPAAGKITCVPWFLVCIGSHPPRRISGFRVRSAVRRPCRVQLALFCSSCAPRRRRSLTCARRTVSASVASRHQYRGFHRSTWRA